MSLNSFIRKTAILGVSRGLGKSLAKGAPIEVGLLVSRKTIESSESFPFLNFEKYNCDFSSVDQVDRLLIKLNEFQPEQIIYVAGGGPFGRFHDKKWKDHEWAWQVSFLTPARLLHWAGGQKQLKQFIVIGSSVAEDNPDPNAASYASAKHALKGLVTSVQKEDPPFDLRLFSPSYMDTDMLPPSSWPRREGLKLRDPNEIAREFWDWALNDDGPKHFRYESPIQGE